MAAVTFRSLRCELTWQTVCCLLEENIFSRKEMENRGILIIKTKSWGMVPGNAFGHPKVKIESCRAKLMIFGVHEIWHLGL